MSDSEPAAAERKESLEGSGYNLAAIGGRISKLKDDGSNIETWLMDMEIELGAHDLWDLVQGRSVHMSEEKLKRKKFTAIKIFQTTMMLKKSAWIKICI